MSLQERIHLFSNLNISNKQFFFPPQGLNILFLGAGSKDATTRERELIPHGKHKVLWHPESQSDFIYHVKRKQGKIMCYRLRTVILHLE